MNRRTFLKTLMALGVSLPMPLDLLAATDPEIDATWQQARDVWGLFEVGEGAVLSFANYEDLDRADAYCLPWADRLSAEEIEHCPPLQWKVSALYVEELEGRDWEKFAKAGWSDWFQGLQGPHRAEVLAELDEWLRDEPDWCWEVDYPTDPTMGEGEGRNRADTFCLPQATQLTVAEIERCQPLQGRVSELYLNELEGRDWERMAETDWAEWFQGLQGQCRDEVHAELDAWLRDEPDWAWEEDYLPDRATAEGAAFEYFNEAGFAVLKALKIRVIEGECPGSSYIAAELGMPVEEANAIAAENAWTIRFVREGAA